MKTKKKNPQVKEIHMEGENRKRNRAYGRRIIDFD